MELEAANQRESASTPVPVHVLRLGMRDYTDVLELQQELRDAVIGGAPDCLVLVQHPPVITIGRGGDERHILARTAPVVRVNRGGDVTYHGPGQLVGYPIVNLARRGRDVSGYLRDLERTVIAAVARFGVAAEQRPGFTGVWVGDDKLAAIGVGIRRWVTMHGFALNVADLRSAFGAIVPCGLTGTGVTSLEQVSGARPVHAAVEAAVVDAFADVFDAAPTDDAPLDGVVHYGSGLHGGSEEQRGFAPGRGGQRGATPHER